MVASVLLSSLCLAAVFAVPEMPEAEWDDTEVVTNAALPAARADSPRQDCSSAGTAESGRL